MFNMYKGDKVCIADEKQRSVMEKAGWSLKKPDQKSEKKPDNTANTGSAKPGSSVGSDQRPK